MSDSKISLQQLAEAFAVRAGLPPQEASGFLRDFFATIRESLVAEKIVKIRGLGTFKLVDVDARESVKVGSGDRYVIDGHTKVTFVPDPVLRDAVNRPFAEFETVVINDGTDLSLMETASEEELEAVVSPRLEAVAAPMAQTVADAEDQPQPSATPVADEATPSEEDGETAEEDDVTPEEETAPSETEDVASEDEEVTPEDEDVTPEDEEVTAEEENATAEDEAEASSEDEALAPEAEEATPEEESAPAAEDTVPTDEEEPTPVEWEDASGDGAEPRADDVPTALVDTPADEEKDEAPVTTVGEATVVRHAHIVERAEYVRHSHHGSHRRRSWLTWVGIIAALLIGYLLGYYFHPFALPSVETIKQVLRAPIKNAPEDQLPFPAAADTISQQTQAASPADSARKADAAQPSQTAEPETQPANQPAAPETQPSTSGTQPANPATSSTPLPADSSVLAYPQLEGGEYDIVGIEGTEVMRPGKTLLNISIKYYGSTKFVDYICTMNGISNPDVVPLDKELKIPTLRKKTRN